MTISSTTTSIVYACNGVQTAFNFNFLIPSDGAGNPLVSVLVENSDGTSAVLTPGSYIFSGADNPSGGTVIYPISGSPLQSGQTLVIMRAVPYTQLTAVSDQAFFPHTLEDMADWLTFQTQQLAEVDARALQFRPGDTGIDFLPPVSLRKGLVLGFDATTGKPVAVAGGTGGGGSSAWSALTGVPNVISAIDVLTPANGQIIEFTGPTTAHMITTPSFSQNFAYSALTGLPNAVGALTSLTPATGQIVEYTGAGTAHMIPTPTGGGGGITGPVSTTSGDLVTWNSAGGTAVGDSGCTPSANGYSLIAAANYAAMRGLLGIGALGLLGDLSTVLLAGTGLAINTVAGVSTMSYTGSGGGATNSTFVGISSLAAPSGSTVTSTLPGSPSAGDLALVKVEWSPVGGITLSSAPSGYTVIHSATDGPAAIGVMLAYKVLTSADIIAGTVVTTFSGSPTGAHQQVAVYRGPTAVSVGQFGSPALGTSHTLTPGFTKNAANIGTVTLVSNNGGGSGVIPTTPGSPFTARSISLDGSFGWSTGWADAINGSVYVDNTTITWGTSPSTNSNGQVIGLELRNDGMSPAGVTSWNGRAGVVTATATDVSTGMGALLYGSGAGKLLAGTGVTFSFNSGTDQLTISAPGGGSGVSSFNGRTGIVSLGASDLVPLVTAGSGISIANLGSSIQISATGGGGGVPINYNGAAENSITPAQSATTNTTNLNNLISSLNAAGGGTIWINGAGAYNVNGTINLKSNVNIIMDGGAYLTWTGAAGGTILSSSSTDVLIQCVYRINVNEGSSFSGTVLNLHSCQFNDMYVLAIGSNTGSIFVNLNADSTAGQFSGGGRNVVFNRFTFQHRGQCQYGLILGGITTGFGGQAQVVTDNTFHNCQFSNAVFRGFKFNNWCDTNTFSGNSYVGLSGLNGLGVVVNEGRVNNFSVYNIHFEHLAVDTFGSGLNRAAVYLYESKQIVIDQLYNDPAAEIAPFVNIACASYIYTISDPGANTMTQHYLGWTTATP